MTRPVHNPGQWPRLMRAETAAAYVDERSVDAFRRAVGVLYPRPVRVEGKGERWLREDLDTAIDRLAGRLPSPASTSPPFDAASVL
jgi:hypothetical protein